MHQYLYIIKEREFVKKRESIYKVGKITQKHKGQMVNYPPKSRIILMISVDDSTTVEKELLAKCRDTFGKPVRGNEIFDANEDRLVDIVMEVAKRNRNTKNNVVYDEHTCSNACTEMFYPKPLKNSREYYDIYNTYKNVPKVCHSTCEHLYKEYPKIFNELYEFMTKSHLLQKRYKFTKSSLSYYNTILSYYFAPHYGSHWNTLDFPPFIG